MIKYLIPIVILLGLTGCKGDEPKFKFQQMVLIQDKFYNGALGMVVGVHAPTIQSCGVNYDIQLFIGGVVVVACEDNLVLVQE